MPMLGETDTVSEKNQSSFSSGNQGLTKKNSFFFSCVCRLFGVFFFTFTVVIYHHLGPHHLGYIFGSFFFSTEQANFRSFWKANREGSSATSNIQRHPPITNSWGFAGWIFSPWNDNSIFAAFQKNGTICSFKRKGSMMTFQSFYFFGAKLQILGWYVAEIFCFTQGIGCER